MPISRSRKKKIKPPGKVKPAKPKPYEVVKHSMYEYGGLFNADVTFEQRLIVILKIGEKATETFEQDYEKLQGYIKDYDPLYLLSFAMLYFLASPEGIDREAIEGKDDFPPFYIEVLQALVLFEARTVSDKPLAEKVQEFYELLQSFNQNQSFRYYQLARNVKTEQELNPVILRMEMMSHTLAVRNWAYEPQMRKVTFDLANLVGAEFENKIGISPNKLLDILFGTVELTTDRLNNLIHKFRALNKARNYHEIFDQYEAEFQILDFRSEEVRMNIWRQSGKNLKNLRYMLCAHADIQLFEVFTISLEDFKSLGSFEIDEETLSVIFDSLSMRFGDLKNHEKDHIFLNNPVHQRPFIKLDDNRYFSAICFLFIYLGVDLLEQFIARDKTLKDNYQKAKGKYLETTLENLFRSAFPSATLMSGSMWHDPESGKDYENDLIVLLNDFAFIIEAKSGTIAPPARRRATDRLFKTLKELIVDPSEQAIRFQNYLKGNASVHNFQTKRGMVNEVNSAKIKYYVPLGVTLSNLGPIGCNLKKLTDAGLVSHKLDELATSIGITDLEVIFDLLPLEGQKIHYLSRRREFEAHLQFQGDEMDLFAFYLENGFNIGDAEYDKNYHFDLTLKSKEIDPYIIGKSRGVDVPKPGFKMTPFWSDLMNMIESRKGPMWLQSTYILMNAPEADQKIFERGFEQLKTQIRKGKAPKDHNWVLLSCGPERRRYAIVGYPYEHISKETRNEMINAILTSEETGHVRGILIIGQDLARKNYPYSVIAGRQETDFLDSLDLE